jgi:hypothetical protein
LKNKRTPVLTADVVKSPKRGGLKALRTQRRKAYYGAQMLRTVANRRRTLARHIRRFPDDAMGCAVYAEQYGGGALKGQLDKITKKAARRLHEKARGVSI